MEDSGAVQDGAGQRVTNNNNNNNNNKYKNRSGGRGVEAISAVAMRIVHRVDRRVEGSVVPSLKKFIFDLHGSSNMFMITQRETSSNYSCTAKDYIGDITGAVDELQLTMPTAPTQPGDKATQCDFEVWKIHDRTKAYKDFKAGLWTVY